MLVFSGAVGAGVSISPYPFLIEWKILGRSVFWRYADLGTTERYVEPSLEAQRRLIALT